MELYPYVGDSLFQLNVRIQNREEKYFVQCEKERISMEPSCGSGTAGV